MTPEEEKQIKEWSSRLSEEIRIELVLTKDNRTDDFREFCETLSELVPTLRITKEKEEAEVPPSIRVGNRLRYQAIPLGTELDPFLQALEMSHKHPQLAEPIRNRLTKITMPALLKLYVAPQCPFCPATVRQLVPLTFGNKFIHLTVIDGMFFRETAESDHIQSVPTLLLEGGFRWTGSINLEELIDVMANRDPSELSAASLQQMISEGNAGRLADMMLENEMIFPGFIDLLLHEHFSIRLGAMVAMEQIADENISLAAKIVKPLWDKFADQDVQVKGDILYTIGECGGEDILPDLKMILDSPYKSEIKEAAQEAIENIEAR
jgi:hypothetical protein